MKALVVYDTKFGNTEKVAKAIAEGLSAGCEVDCKKVSDIDPSELRAADLVLVGSPTHAWNMSSNTKIFSSDWAKSDLRGRWRQRSILNSRNELQGARRKR